MKNLKKIDLNEPELLKNADREHFDLLENDELSQLLGGYKPPCEWLYCVYAYCGEQYQH